MPSYIQVPIAENFHNLPPQMTNFSKKLHHLCSSSPLMVDWLIRSTRCLAAGLYPFILLGVNSFWIQLCYFVCLSFLGFGVLKVLEQGTDSSRPRNLDLFFTSASATTVSSMSTVEMEVFSNTQLIVLTILMFIGGEVFTSMVGLLFKFKKIRKIKNKLLSPVNHENISQPGINVTKNDFKNLELGIDLDNTQHEPSFGNGVILKYNSIKFLCFVVLGYHLVVHVVGISLVTLYMSLVSTARNTLKSKGLNMLTFSVFTTVSTFASCGFVPTNENMLVFSKNSGLLLILIPQVLFGNTLFPSCLRFSVWFLGKYYKKPESNYLLKKTGEIGYLHLLPSLHSSLLVVTVLGFILIQCILFWSLEWNSVALNELNSYQKIVGVLFQTVNTRHTGETIVDLSIISPAILVLFIVMMYLPPYTSFLPVKVKDEEDKYCENDKKRRGKLLENIIFSQLSYLVIFIIFICITERQKIKQDPLNFSVLNIVTEIISAYGNVGFTTGYSCERQVNREGNCQNRYYGFSGKWSDEGKIILILVMLFGRLKKFNMDRGKAWKLM